MSESRAYSDSFADFPANRVRITGLFGQLCGMSSHLCPNHRLILTAVRDSQPLVSKSRAYSDSFAEFPAICVRITDLFGQLCGISSHSCPNHRLILTALRISQLIVSESQAYSDSFAEFPAIRVRITGLF
ncbi:MAG TPA: hypothetical protein VNM69_07555 [Bacillus sp. (in: firmicutes)]|nr:hypothetical protein [Bacillus sp. (in: firmicutes)]